MQGLICSYLNENRINYNLLADLSEISSVRIGGVADILITPSRINELITLLKFLDEHKIPRIIIGRASNILFMQDRISVPVIQTTGLGNVWIEGEYVCAECGVSLARLSHICRHRGLSGLEELSGIPGTVGAAVASNAGAFGRDISSVVSEVTVIGENDKAPCILKVGECNFGYRNSRFVHSGETVLACRFKLSPDKISFISERMELYKRKRLETQPHGTPSLGSVFKRPEKGYAGEMIELCGLKGHVQGGAAISNVHAGFIVNLGGATAADYIALCYLAKKSVFEKFSVALEPEIRFV